MRESASRVTAEYQRRGMFEPPGEKFASICDHCPVGPRLNDE
jgi:hypothetical protein